MTDAESEEEEEEGVVRWVDERHLGKCVAFKSNYFAEK